MSWSMSICFECGNYLFWDLSKAMNRKILISEADWPISHCPSCNTELQDKCIGEKFIDELLNRLCEIKEFDGIDKKYIKLKIRTREDFLARASLAPRSFLQENYDFLYDLDKSLGDSIYPELEKPSKSSRNDREFYSGDDVPF